MKLLRARTNSPRRRRALIALVIAVVTIAAVVGEASRSFAAGVTASPSGLAMPVSAPTGYHPIMFDDFSGNALDADKWSAFDGPSSSSSTWKPGNATVGNGQLDLRSTRTGAAWTTAGVDNAIGLSQTYGEYNVRFRIGVGDGITSDFLLWPTDGHSNEGYIDFSQSQTGDRRTLGAYLQPSGGGAGIASSIATNLTGWHTVGVIWSAGRVQYLLDGVVWKTVTSAQVPSTGLSLQMKTQAWTCSTASTCLDATTPAVVNDDIDWTVVDAPGAAVSAGTPVAHAAHVPGGLGMPTTNPAGWHEVLADNFTGRGLNTAKWSAYSGSLPSDHSQHWSPSQLAVTGNHELVLHGSKDASLRGAWLTGGLSSKPALVQTYGMYQVRFRVSSGNLPYVALLWPADNTSTHEIDFAEDLGGSRQTTYATLHNFGRLTRKSLSVNLTKWHTMGVVWLPGSLQYTIDGHVWATVTGKAVPSVPMVLDLQLTTWPCHNPLGESCPTRSTKPVSMDVAWVTAYARN